MSDEPGISPYPGTISPRDIDTVSYRVVTACGPWQPGDTFSAWPQGEVWAHVNGIGMGVVKNSEIAEWLKAGKVVRL